MNINGTDLNRLIETELLYFRCFSERKETPDFISYTDSRLPDMYDHNFFYIEKDTDIQLVSDLAGKEYKRVQEKGEGHVKILFEPGWEPTVEVQAFVPFTKETYLFMGADTDSYSLFKPREDCRVKELASEKEAEEVFQLEIDLFSTHADNFGPRRGERKLAVYQDRSIPLEICLCYHKGRLIGDCEIFIPGNGLVKIEDFDIRREFQKQGFGSAVLYYILKKSSLAGIPFVYLVADKQETAQHMYTKCHFSVLYEQTCLFYLFEKGVT